MSFIGSVSNILLDEEIVSYSAESNYGVCAKNIIRPKNLFKSYSPYSTNHKISFSNTIMIPFIKTESSNEIENPNEKSKLSTKKDITRIKTDSSKDERINISTEKRITKILIDTIDEKSNEIDQTNLEFKEQKDYLETNPFFLGGKYSVEITNLKMNDTQYENEKVLKLLNKNNNNDEINNYLKITKDENIHFSQSSKLKNKIKKIKSYNITKVSKFAHFEKDEEENKTRKSKTKFKTEKSTQEKSNKIYKKRNSVKNLDTKANKEFSYRRSRGNSIKHHISLLKLKDKNIKSYKTSLFNKKSSSNLQIYSKLHTDIKKECLKDNKNKNARVKYKGISHKFLDFGFGIDSKDENKLNKKNGKDLYLKKESKEQENDFDNNHKLKSSRKNSVCKSNIKRMKTLTNENNTNEKKKFVKHFNFESALKSKKNLGKTQFNLFSPDKFTNTQFCGSDYLEYTLDCMELLLKSSKSQKQTKNKVNLNFPKPKGNKIKKKIALFDLDETLVHCTGDINKKEETYQHCIEVVLPCNKKTKVGINIRPLWKKTLNLIKRHYYIVVFTASHQAYADAVLNFMDPDNKYFKYRLYRNNCSLVDVDGVKFYVKDLDIFDEFYDLKDIIIVDNSVLSFIYHLENGIPIVPYYNEDKDGSLYVVGLYLMHIFKENDLREANKKYINLESFLDEAKNRKNTESSISEQSINNDDNINDVNNEDNKANILKDNSESKNNNTNKDKPLIDKNNNGHNTRRCSFSIGFAQRKLMSKSKLMNMYYEINSNRALSDKKIEELMEEQNNNSISIDENQEIGNNKKYKNMVDLFFGKRLLTSDDKPLKNKRNSKSNKDLYNKININYIHSNFYNKFSEGGFLVK